MILARCLNCHPGKIAFSFNEHGRPEIGTTNAINFNLSHSGDMALIALSRVRTVGVDLNHLGQTREWGSVARRSFSHAEQESLFRLPAPIQEKMFYQIWSQKEAYTKALGHGFSYGFQNFTVVVDPGTSTGFRSGLVSDDKQPEAVGDWVITSVEVGADWIAALAFDAPSLRTSPPLIRQWEFCYDT